MLADNLVMLRNLKGLTQEQVAEVVGISRQSYAKMVTIGSKGQIVIPKAARDTFNLREGDSLVVLGDDAEGIALIKSVDFENKIQEAMRLSQQKAEEKNE